MEDTISISDPGGHGPELNHMNISSGLRSVQIIPFSKSVNTNFSTTKSCVFKTLILSYNTQYKALYSVLLSYI